MMALLGKLPLVAVLTALLASEGQNTPWTPSPAPVMDVSDVFNHHIDHTNSSSLLPEGNTTAYNDPCFYYIHILFPLIFLGLCGNIVILVVWNAESAFKPTTFFMKCLAVSDILLLLTYFFQTVIVEVVGSEDIVTMVMALSVLCWFRILSAHTTLAVVFTRWLAVCRPLKVNSLLRKRRVVSGFVLILLWSMTALVPLLLVPFQDFASRVNFTIINITEIVYLALPIILLIVMNVHMVRTLRSRMSSFGDGGRAARASDESDNRKLFAAILCLSITTVLAYPLGVLSRVFLNIALQHVPATSASTLLAVSLILEAFNSSINVVYYLLFVSRFRQLFRRRCCCCCREKRQETSLETQTAWLESKQ